MGRNDMAEYFKFLVRVEFKQDKQFKSFPRGIVLYCVVGHKRDLRCFGMSELYQRNVDSFADPLQYGNRRALGAPLNLAQHASTDMGQRCQIIQGEISFLTNSFLISNERQQCE